MPQCCPVALLFLERPLPKSRVPRPTSVDIDPWSACQSLDRFVCRVHLRDFVLANQISVRRRAAHNFVRRHATASFLLEQGLRDHCLLVTQRALSEPCLFSSWNTSITRSIVFAEVVCRVPNTRCPVSAAGQSQTDCLEIAHLSNQNDVRVLTQRRTQGSENPVSRCTSRWLTKHRLLFSAQLDGVLDGQNVVVTVVIDEINHRSKRG